MPQWDAKDYAKNSGAQQGWAVELMGKLRLDGDERILDIGCGDGKVTVALADRVPDGAVVGIDSSNEMIGFAQESHASYGPRLAFEVGDAAELHFEREFDVVFSNAAIHWVPDHQAVVQGISRALRPGGQVLLSFGGKGNVVDLIEAAKSLTDEPAWAPYFEDASSTYTFRGPEDWTPLLTDAGLEAVRVELVPKDMVHTPDNFKGWLRTTWMLLTQRVPEENREQFLDEFVRHYLDRCPPDAEGLVHARMVRLEVEACKR